MTRQEETASRCSQTASVSQYTSETPRHALHISALCCALEKDVRGRKLRGNFCFFHFSPKKEVCRLFVEACMQGDCRCCYSGTDLSTTIRDTNVSFAKVSSAFYFFVMFCFERLSLARLNLLKWCSWKKKTVWFTSAAPMVTYECCMLTAVKRVNHLLTKYLLIAPHSPNTCSLGWLATWISAAVYDCLSLCVGPTVNWWLASPVPWGAWERLQRPPATLSADEVATENGQMGIVVANQSHVGPQWTELWQQSLSAKGQYKTKTHHAGVFRTELAEHQHFLALQIQGFAFLVQLFNFCTKKLFFPPPLEVLFGLVFSL